MAKRDPEKTARNKLIETMSEELRSRLPRALELSGALKEQSLHARYGGKHAQFIDIKHAVIHTPEHFVALWLKGYMYYLRQLEATKGMYAKSSSYYQNFVAMQQHPELWTYIEVFLKRTFLRFYDSLARTRPTVERSTIWIGQNNASYGLLVTPRFAHGNWENDKSEIRHFPKDYWTIGHVLKTGLVIPFKDEKIQFANVDAYLTFFEHVLVRNSGSPHEGRIAQRYTNFVRSAQNPEKVPLLIPEFRYAGIAGNHVHRLDFCVIDPFTMNRVGFELSPWSTHGELTKIKGLSQKAVNEIAQGNFEAEMKKLKAYFKEHEIYALIYTDTDLQNPDSVFADIARFLLPEKAAQQLQLSIRDEFLAFRL